MAETELGAKLAAGRTAEVFAWGEGRVLKLFREGWGGDVAAHEAQVASAIFDAGAPAPKVYGVVEVAGRAGVIYERIEGPSLLGALRGHPGRLLRAAKVMAETHTAMHARTMSGLPLLREVLAGRIHVAAPLPAAYRDAALRALDALPDGAALCHGDYHPDNVLLAARGPLVIDWENAALGDPLADVTRTTLLLRVSAIHARSPVARTVRRMTHALLTARYLHAYRRLRPFEAASLAAWELPVTAARLSEGIAREEAYLLARVGRLVASNLNAAPTPPH